MALKRRRRFVRPTPPTAAQLTYLRALREVVGYAQELVKARLVPRLETLKPAQVERVFDSIDGAFWGWYTTERVRRIVGKEALQVNAHNRAQLARQLEIDPSQVDVRRRTTVARIRGDAEELTAGGALRQTIQQFTAENVALIKTLPAQALAEVQQSVLQGMAKGLRHEEIASQIAERFVVARSRAALIARDQVNKFNGNLNRVRQQNLGVEKFIWHTAGDERVRDRHADFNLKVYTWAEGTGEGDDPAVGAFPGQAIQCRCFAEPVIDLEEDDLEEAEPPEDLDEPD